jgi:hypothetical protein
VCFWLILLIFVVFGLWLTEIGGFIAESAIPGHWTGAFGIEKVCPAGRNGAFGDARVGFLARGKAFGIERASVPERVGVFVSESVVPTKRAGCFVAERCGSRGGDDDCKGANAACFAAAGVWKMEYSEAACAADSRRLQFARFRFKSPPAAMWICQPPRRVAEGNRARQGFIVTRCLYFYSRIAELNASA